MLNIYSIFLLFTATDVKLFGISLVLYSLSISMGFATFVFFTSRTDRPPIYHWVSPQIKRLIIDDYSQLEIMLQIFALLNFFGSNLFIFAASSELASVLNTLGLLFNCTASIIGVTVLAIGNSVSDLLANITLSRQGHQRMAFAACFGGSIFSKRVTY